LVANIRRVWSGDKRATIIAIDAEDGREKACFVWTDTTHGQLIASLCARLENNGGGMSPQQIALTVKPKHKHFGYEIEAAELIPTEASA
jgi:hypothetical protein